MDKFTLVYEFNKDSPLITYQAAKEIEAKNYSKALEMLNTAVEKFPNHLSALLLLSEALAYNEKYDEAREVLKRCQDINYDKDTQDFYLNRIEIIKREAEGISVDLDDTVNEILNEAFLESSDFDTDQEFELLEDNFDVKESEEDKDLSKNSIVTETLAEIYASQENYDEALDIYEKLMKLKPEMEIKFSNRISEIKTAIDNKKRKKIGN